MEPKFCMYPTPAIGERQWVDDGTERKTYEWNGAEWSLILIVPLERRNRQASGKR